jgi:N-acetylneuraminic acid mutarotase
MKRHIVWILAALVAIVLLSLASISPAEAGEWTRKADMPTARDRHSASVVNGRIYAIGGWGTRWGAGFGSDAVEEYDPVNDKWKKRTPMPTLRYEFSTSAVNGRIYAIGGWDMAKNIFLSSVEEYDPAADTWTKKTDMPTERGLFSTSAVNGKIYAFGGGNRRGGRYRILSVVEEYDPVTDTWAEKSDMPRKRYNFSTSAVNGKIYAIGGFTGMFYTPVSWVEEYDPVTDTWTKKNDMPAPPRAYHAAAVVNRKIYVIGGAINDSDSPLSTVEIYDPVTDSWEKGLDMPAPRRMLSANAVNGKIYAIGGSTAAGNPLSTVEEYDPESVAVEPRGKLAATWGEVKCD